MTEQWQPANTAPKDGRWIDTLPDIVSDFTRPRRLRWASTRDALSGRVIVSWTDDSGRYCWNVGSWRAVAGPMTQI